MQTIYTTSYRLGVRCDNVIDLNEYRRKLGQLTEEPSQPEIEVEPLLWAREKGEDAPAPRPRRALSAGAWLLDICASAGVLAMTLAFTVHIL